MGARLPCVVGGRQKLGLTKIVDAAQSSFEYRLASARGTALLCSGASVAGRPFPIPTQSSVTYSMATNDTAGRGHLWRLTLIFCLWKAVLLSLAAFSPGPGYDTSALILLDSSIKRHENFSTLSRYRRLILNLLRWDALYFVKAAERDKLFEQEWAFSWVYSRLIGIVTRCKWAQLTGKSSALTFCGPFRKCQN